MTAPLPTRPPVFTPTSKAPGDIIVICSGSVARFVQVHTQESSRG